MTNRRAWVLVGFMAFALFLDNITRHVIFSIFPVLKSKMHFSDVELGLTGSIFLWVYAICSPIAGQIGDRFSKRKLITLSLFLWSGITILTGASHSVWTLLTCRGLLGVAEALFMPAAMALLANAHGPQTRSLALNLFVIGEYAGVAVGGWYGSYVAQEFDWRRVFFSLGMLGIIYTLPYGAFLRGFPDPPAEKAPKFESRWSIAELVKVPSYQCLCAAYCALVFAMWLLYTWLPTFLYEKFSLSLAEAGFSATVYVQSATVFASLASAALADRLYRKKNASRFWICCAGFLLAAPCLYLMGTSGSLVLTKVFAVGAGLCFGMLSNLGVAAFDVVPRNTRASAIGYINLVSLMSQGVASMLEGKLKASVGIGSMLIFAGIVCLVAGVLLVVCVRFFFQRDHDCALAGMPESSS